METTPQVIDLNTEVRTVSNVSFPLIPYVMNSFIDSSSQRVGGQVHFRYLRVNGIAYNNPVFQWQRLVIFVDRQPAATLGSAGPPLFTDITPANDYDPSGYLRFVVLYEIFFAFENPSLNSALPFNIEIPLDFVTTYFPGFGVSTPSTNGLLLAVTSCNLSTGASTTPSGRFGFTLTYDP